MGFLLWLTTSQDLRILVSVHLWSGSHSLADIEFFFFLYLKLIFWIDYCRAIEGSHFIVSESSATIASQRKASLYFWKCCYSKTAWWCQETWKGISWRLAAHFVRSGAFICHHIKEKMPSWSADYNWNWDFQEVVVAHLFGLSTTWNQPKRVGAAADDQQLWTWERESHRCRDDGGRRRPWLREKFPWGGVIAKSRQQEWWKLLCRKRDVWWRVPEAADRLAPSWGCRRRWWERATPWLVGLATDDREELACLFRSRGIPFCLEHQ
jgi:hypothetical protein